MKTKRNLLLLYILLTAMLLERTPKLDAQPVQNLVQNPGFETGDFTGWNVYTGIYSYAAVETNLVHSGSYSANFGVENGDTGFLGQTLSTEVGASYSISFWLNVGFSCECVVSWNGTNVYDTDFTNSTGSDQHPIHSSRHGDQC